MSTQAPVDPLAAGREALERADWSAACDAFEAALGEGETAEALDGLGQARWWLNDLEPAIELRSRAYASYVELGRPAPAIRIAAWLAREYFTVHGNMAATAGWINRAESLLSKAGPCREEGWLALIKSALAPDPEQMKELAAEAIDVAKRFEDSDLEIVGLSAIGLGHVYANEVGDGMARLDEAMAAAIGGELRSFWAFSDVYCNTLLACERAGDFERAEQWCRIVMEFSRRADAKPLFPFCHVTYGAILTATGRWAEAEAEFELAARLFAIGHKGMRVIALARLADLRVRQGRVEEAARLLEGYEEHPLAVRAAVRLHIVLGRASLAAGLVRRRLDQVGAGSTLAAPLLSLLVEAQLEIGNSSAAAETARALSELADKSEQRSISAEAEFARGAVALALEEEGAVLHLDRAVELFGGLEQPLEAARARLLSARARVNSDRDVAVSDTRTALATFERLGAQRDVDAASEQLREFGEAGPAGPRGVGALTKREEEVLRLLAEGLSNAEIGRRLFISVKTVEHHVGNVLRKLGLRSRTEAAAHLLRHYG